MTILMISCVAPPEPGVSGQTMHDVATFLGEKGHNVYLLSPYPSRPLSAKYEEFKTTSILNTSVEKNITIVRVPSFTHPQSSIFGRLRESYSFGKHVVNYIINQKSKIDLVYALPWPYLGQYIIAKHLKKLNIPLIMNVQDVYPESFLEKIPVFFRYLLEKPMISIDKKIANWSNHLVVISENMRKIYTETRFIPNEKITTIINWQDESVFVNLDKGQNYRKIYNLPEAHRIYLYLGNIGPVAGIDHLIASFYKANLQKATLVIAGSGTDRQRCIDLAHQIGLENIIFLDVPSGLEHVARIQSTADVLLLPVKKGAAMSSIPSKLIAYMFSGKPIVASVDIGSDSAIAIKDSQGGWTVPPEDINCLVNQLILVHNMSQQELKQMGENARSYGLSNHSKTCGINRTVKLLTNFELIRIC